MRCGLAVSLLALVALEAPLCHKLLCLGAQATVVAIDEDLFMALINRPPFRADIDPTCDANLVPGLLNDGSGVDAVVEGRRPLHGRTSGGNRSGRGTPINVVLVDHGWSGCRRLRRHRDEVGFSDGARKSQIRLLKVLHIQL